MAGDASDPPTNYGVYRLILTLVHVAIVMAFLAVVVVVLATGGRGAALVHGIAHGSTWFHRWVSHHTSYPWG